MKNNFLLFLPSSHILPIPIILQHTASNIKGEESALRAFIIVSNKGSVTEATVLDTAFGNSISNTPEKSAAATAIKIHIV